ncbi:UMP kinase [Candidatus Gottesmanbacteria bacterium]|nr:UMP kinase [Candidatus Gottesmanbacteria bacterium]
MASKSPIILSLGGSLVVPNGGIDTKFLAKFNEFIRKKIATGARFFIVVGGGAIARHYRDAGKDVVGKITDIDLDWLGIHATRLNGHLLRTIFQDLAHPRIVENYNKRLYNLKEPLVIAAGWKPGWSTDYCAVLLAQEYKSKIIVNMSNIKKVYTSDPNKDSKARPIDKISWEDFSKLVGDKWMPGSNSPFDPVASRLAREMGLTVYVLDGKDVDNLENALENRPFIGTVIR